MRQCRQPTENGIPSTMPNSTTDIGLHPMLTCMNRKPQTRIAETRTHYDEIGGSSYDLLYLEEQVRKYAVALEMVNVMESDVVLDLGCGTGLFMDRYAGRVSSFVGLDLSAELLSTAKKRLGGRTHTSLLLSDAHSLPFRTGVFDKVFMFTIVQNSPQPMFLLCGASRVLGSSGKLIVSGLRKSFDRRSFEDLLQKSCLSISCFTERDPHDYIAVCVAQGRWA